MSKTSFAGLTPSGGSRVDFAAIKGAVDLVAVIESRGVDWSFSVEESVVGYGPGPK